MTSNEEKIKGFFSDEKNIKMIAKDKDFMDKVSKGKATHSDYVEKFRNMGFELSYDEIEEIRHAVPKILDATVKKLNDETLKDVSGGMMGAGSFLGEIILYTLVSGGLVVGGAVGTVACAVAAGVSAYKGSTNLAAGLTVAAVGCAGMTAAGVAMFKKGC